MRHRHYHALTGRFTQEDPAGLGGGLNLYGFGSGDPINFDDPFGLGPGDDCRAHGYQNWSEYKGAGGVSTSKTSHTVQIVHDCSAERKAAAAQGGLYSVAGRRTSSSVPA
jgi:uncharacterized protein RhaS with RHS repeats